MLCGLTLSQRSLEVVRISFNSFFFSLSLLPLFPPFYLPPNLSSLLPQLFYCWSLLIDSSIYFKSLLNISCIFLILVSSLFICNGTLFSRFWIIFTIIILIPFPGILLISSSFVLSGVFLSWWIFTFT